MNSRIGTIIAVLATFISLLVWINESHPEGRDAVIALRQEVTISNPIVTVGTIADIRSEDKVLGEQLSGINLERAPVVGYTRIFTIDDIKSRLRQHKIDLSQITFVGHEQVAVVTKAIEITPEQLLNFARNYLHENIFADIDASSIDFAAAPIKLTVPAGEITFRIPCDPSKIRLSQYISLPVQIILNGKTYRTLILSLKAKLVKKVVVATKLIPQNKPISDADIDMAERDIISILTSRCSGWLRTSALVEKSDVYGKRAKKQIAPGEILTSEIVEIPPLISRRDKVTIIIELPHLKVTALGRAKEDGYEGQSIRVENASSQKIITAKVINEKLVRVEL